MKKLKPAHKRFRIKVVIPILVVLSYAAIGSGLFVENKSNPTVSASLLNVADVNNDGNVDTSDLSYLRTKWGTADTIGDINKDGIVNIFDSSLLVSKWGATTAPTLWLPAADKPLGLHWVLGGTLNVNDPVQMGTKDFNGNTLPEPDVYDIDGELNTKATVDALKAKNKKVICYFDAGVYETYRSDAHKFPQSVIGNPDVGWDGSFWLDIRQTAILEPIMKARMQMCKDKGFDSIEPDEIDGWENDSGFPLTYQDQITYNRLLAQWAHEIGLSIGLKGDLIQVRDLVSYFDWTLNEECFQYNECTNPWDPNQNKEFPGLQLFVQQNKAVWVAEYKAYTTTAWSVICQTSQTNKFNTTRFKLGLPNNGGRMPCPTTSSAVW